MFLLLPKAPIVNILIKSSKGIIVHKSGKNSILRTHNETRSSLLQKKNEA